MDLIEKMWKDARLEYRTDIWEGEISVHLYNLDELKITRKDIGTKYDEMRKLLNKFEGEQREKLYDTWKELSSGNINTKNDKEMVKLLFNILYGELLKHENRVEATIDKMTEILEKEISQNGK